MTRDEYKRLVLQSANADGEINPPQLTSWSLRQEILVEMEIKDRTIKTISTRNEPMRWAITSRGRLLAKGDA